MHVALRHDELRFAHEDQRYIRCHQRMPGQLLGTSQAVRPPVKFKLAVGGRLASLHATLTRPRLSLLHLRTQYCIKSMEASASVKMANAYAFPFLKPTSQLTYRRFSLRNFSRSSAASWAFCLAAVSKLFRAGPSIRRISAETRSITALKRVALTTSSTRTD